MTQVTTSKIRNVALVGHQGNGKTTLAEAMLGAAGVINRIGRVEDGNTVLDNDPEERARGQSLQLGLASFGWNGHWINLLDTPGYADFAGDAHSALAVADLAVFVIDAVAGPQVHDDLMWAVASERQMPRMIFVNKVDRARASFDRTVAQLREHFGQGVEPIELPVGEEAEFHGIADLITEHAFLYDTGKVVETAELPPPLAERERAEHEHLVEDVVELADDLLAKYLEGEEISVAELETALHDGVDRGVVWPVLVGSAIAGIGVDRLLEFICHVGPAPSDLPGVDVTAGDQTVTVACDPAAKPLLHVFKTVTDDYVGQVSMFKVISGTVRADDSLVNTRTGKPERLHSLMRVVGSEHSGTSTVVAGEIAAAIKLSDVVTGDTLAPQGSPVVVQATERDPAVYAIALAAKAKADEDKLAVALSKLVHEDPTLEVVHDGETHQTLLRGAGDAHIQVALSRLAKRYGVETVTEPVKVAYRETLGGNAEVEGKHKKQTGGRGQYGVAFVRFEPLDRGAGFDFVDRVTGGAVPRGLIPAVGKGIQESMLRGGPHGFPMVDLRATLFDGKYHSVDSDEMSFKMAGALALRAAIEQVGTQVLEPISRVRITVPSDLQGDVMADLSGRRGHIENTDHVGNGHVTVTAMVPTSEIVDYAVTLRSMTHGRGRFVAEFDHYQVLSGPLPAAATAAKK